VADISPASDRQVFVFTDFALLASGASVNNFFLDNSTTCTHRLFLEPDFWVNERPAQSSRGIIWPLNFGQCSLQPVIKNKDGAKYSFSRDLLRTRVLMRQTITLARNRNQNVIGTRKNRKGTRQSDVNGGGSSTSFLRCL
jgi:hypothetical protein